MSALPPGCVAAGYYPGALGEACALQAAWYAREWGFGLAFETRVATEMAAFLQRFDPARDLFDTVRHGNALVGAVAIDGEAPGNRDAHLRWFVVADAMQGRGLGRALLARAVDFARTRGYETVWLATFAGLDAARRLYDEAGFRVVREERGTQWGREVAEQVMRVRL